MKISESEILLVCTSNALIDGCFNKVAHA
jgi:hypothetical protein